MGFGWGGIRDKSDVVPLNLSLKYNEGDRNEMNRQNMCWTL